MGPHVLQATGWQAGKAWSAALVAVAIVAATTALWATQPKGPGVCPDGRTYLTSARLITEGHGYSDYPRGDSWEEPRPVTQFPPLYPMTLAGARLVGLDGVEGARILQALLLAASVTLLGWVIAGHLQSGVAGLLAAALFAFAPAVIYVHLWVWSEPLCFVLIISSMAALVRQENTQRSAYLIAAIAACSLALLTRFSSLSLLSCGCALLFVGRGELKLRLARSAAFGAVGSLVFLAWIVRNRLIAGESVAFEPHVALMRDEGLEFVETLAEWVLPLPVWPGFKIVALCALLCWAGFAFLRAARKPAGERNAREVLVIAGGTLALVHVLFIFAARRVVGTALGLDDRILGPALLGLIMLAAGALQGRWRWAGAIVAMTWLIGSALYAAKVYDQGLAYLGTNWR